MNAMDLVGYYAFRMRVHFETIPRYCRPVDDSLNTDKGWMLLSLLSLRSLWRIWSEVLLLACGVCGVWRVA